MLATLLLLAQLVQPWPGLDSPRVQPGPTICVGECAGPVVWGPAERGRLVVACDMRSDTCSDGRRITTQRATPVPCETSPGVWEMVPANTACISYRGLESWASTTTHLSYGAELDREVWGKIAGAAVERAGEVWRVSATSGSSLLVQTTPTIGGETWTASCRVLAGTSTTIRMAAVQAEAGGSTVTHTLSPGWGTYSVTSTSTSDGNAGVWLYPTSDGAGDIYVAGCWLTYAATPGRPCWGGEAPVTCAADRHNISTEGWPTTSGSMRFVVRLLGDATEHRAVFDGGADAVLRMAIQTNGAIRLSWDGSNPVTPALAWEYDRPYVIELRFNGSTISMFRDGVFLRDFTYSRPVEWAPIANLGTTSTGWFLNGSIRALTVRSYEEVSP